MSEQIALNIDCMEQFLPTAIDNRYYISSLGRVYSCIRKRMLKPIKQKNGYFAITISRKMHNIHRMVAEIYIPNPYDLPCVNHIDGNKENNSVTNLEWCTPSQNLIHAYNLLLNKKPRPVCQISNGVVIKRFKSAREAERNGFQNQLIAKCCRGKRKTHAGYQWRYADDI